MSVAMAVLVLFSTLSLTIEKHFCGDALVDVSVFTTVQKCSSDEDSIEHPVIMKKSCCKDTVDLVEGQDELLLKTFNDLDDQELEFLVSLVYSFSYVPLLEQKKHVSHKHYEPPNLFYDIQVLYETYLI